jgi:hypothetical protein
MVVQLVCSVYNLAGGGVASGSSVAVAVASSAADPKNPIMLDMVSLIFFLSSFGIDVGEHLS